MFLTKLDIYRVRSLVWSTTNSQIYWFWPHKEIRKVNILSSILEVDAYTCRVTKFTDKIQDFIAKPNNVKQMGL